MRTTRTLKRGVVVQLRDGIFSEEVPGNTFTVIRTQYYPHARQKEEVLLIDENENLYEVHIREIECVLPKENYPEYYL